MTTRYTNGYKWWCTTCHETHHTETEAQARRQSQVHHIGCPDASISIDHEHPHGLNNEMRAIFFSDGAA